MLFRLRNCVKILILLLAAAFILPLQAQDYIADVKYFGIEDGLSHREVYCSYEDDQGFIWLSTKYGLNRFDGYEFKLFTKENDGLASNEIHQLFQDKSDWLWLISVENIFELSDIKSISFLNPVTKEVRSIKEHFGADLPFEVQDLEHIYINELNKLIFLGTHNGQVFIYENGKSFKLIAKTGWENMFPRVQPSANTLLVESSSKEVSATLYEVTLDGEILNSWDVFEHYFLGIAPDANVYTYFKSASQERDPPMDFFSLQAESKLEPVALPLSIYPLNNDDWFSKLFYKKNDHTIWYKSEARFFVFDLQKGRLFDFNESYPDISKNVIWDIYFDRSDRAFIATSHGFYIIRLSINPFQRLMYNSSNTYDVNSFFSCRGIVAHQNTLWIGTEFQNNHRIDLNNLQAERLPHFEFSGRENQIRLGEGRVVISLDNDHLLFGDNELIKYRISDASIQFHFWEDGSSPPIWSMFKDQKDTIWVGTYDGPLGYWQEGMKEIQVYEQLNDFEFQEGGYIYSFLELNESNILMGTSFGIYLLQRQKGIIKRFWTEGIEEAHFPHNNIFHLVKDKDKNNIIWVATGGGGLIKWSVDLSNIGDKKGFSKEIKQFTIAHGLSNNTIYASYEDEAGNLWLPSDYGIIQFNKHTQFTKAYLVKDGITFNEFNRISHHEGKQGKLYFGGLNGITAFQPINFTTEGDSLNVPLKITEFQQFDSETEKIVDRTAELLKNGQILLHPGDRFFQLKFALLEYQNTAHIRYAYIIEGQDIDWNTISDNSLRISGLDYGNYTLRIRGQGANGQFSKQELSLPIQVLKPFYLKTWFLILVILSVMGLVTAWYKNRTIMYKRQQAVLEKKVLERTETIEQQKKELQQLDKVKSRFFANVSHELRTPLTLMLGPLGSVLKSKDLNNKNFTLIKLVQGNAKNLLGLVNEIMDLTKMESGKLELKEEAVLLYPLTQRILAAFESHAQGQNVDFEFHFNADQYLQVKVDKNKYEKILSNLLSNAIKFTSSGQSIIVQLQDFANRIQLKVIDTGRGIHQNDIDNVFNRFYQSAQPDTPVEGGTGIGLALCMEYSKLMNGKLWVESTLGKGSTFYFEFSKKQVFGMVDSEKLIPEDQVTSEVEDLTNYINASFLESEVETQKANILVVEDNHALRNYLQLILSENYQVKAVENGQVAWDYLLEDGRRSTADGKIRQPSTVNRQPDLIISDIMMPLMDGYQLLSKLKGNDLFRNLPVIMLTARAEMQDKLKAIRIGVDDYMLKPFEEEELFARIENLLRNSQQRKIAFEKFQLAITKSQNVTQIGSASETELEFLQLPQISADELNWLEEVENTVKIELTNFEFNVERLSEKMALSKRQLERKLKRLTGITPRKYIQEVRFNYARNLLENKSESSVKAVAYSIGVKDVAHFSKLFKERFGKLPSEYF